MVANSHQKKNRLNVFILSIAMAAIFACGSNSKANKGAGKGADTKKDGGTAPGGGKPPGETSNSVIVTLRASTKVTDAAALKGEMGLAVHIKLQDKNGTDQVFAKTTIDAEAIKVQAETGGVPQDLDGLVLNKDKNGVEWKKTGQFPTIMIDGSLPAIIFEDDQGDFAKEYLTSVIAKKDGIDLPQLITFETPDVVLGADAISIKTSAAPAVTADTIYNPSTCSFKFDVANVQKTVAATLDLAANTIKITDPTTLEANGLPVDAVDSTLECSYDFEVSKTVKVKVIHSMSGFKVKKAT